MRQASCANTSQLACSDTTLTPSAAETINQTALAAGKYYIFFDTRGTGGTADVLISVTQ